MSGSGSGGDDAERRLRITLTPHASGARESGSTSGAGRRLCSNAASSSSTSAHSRASSGSSTAGSSFAGALSSRQLTPVEREPEELGPLAVKLETDTTLRRRGVVGPEDYLPPRQEDDLERAIMARSARKEEEAEARRRRELEIDEIFYEQGVAESEAQASKEADVRIMKAEQSKKLIDLVSDED